MDQSNRIRNLALTTETHDAEFLLEISLGGQVLVTVGEPAGSEGAIREFRVWDGPVQDDEYENVVMTFSNNKTGTIDMAWLAAVQHAYELALDKGVKLMMQELRKEVA